MPSSTIRSGGTRRARYEFGDAVVRRAVDISHHSLVHAVMCIAVERIRRDTAGAHAALTRERDEFRQTRVTAFTNAQLFHPPGAYRLEDRVDAVDDHQAGAVPSPVEGDAPSASLNALARSAGLAIGRMPESRSAAPRAIAGTARSSSNPSGSPMSARRIGCKSALPFTPVRSRTRADRGAKRVAIEQRLAAGQHLGQRRNHRPCGLGLRAHGRRRPARAPPNSRTGNGAVPAPDPVDPPTRSPAAEPSRETRAPHPSAPRSTPRASSVAATAARGGLAPPAFM